MADRTVAIDVFARDRASATFNKIGSAASKNSGHVSNFGRNFGKVGAGIARAGGLAGAALAGLGIAGVTMGIKTAASLQQADIAFTTLLHSGQKSKAFLTDLKKFAAATPFTLPGLVDASRQLLGAGASAKSVIPTLTNFGDAAGALGLSQDRFNHVMLATTQAMAAGKLQAGDLLQMTEAGLPVWKLLSEATGKPIPKLRELSKQGKLLTKDTLPLLERQMHKDYGGAMAKQSQTLSGLWSTFTDTLNQGLASALMPLVPVLQKALPGAMKAMGAGLKWVSTHIASMVAGVQNGTGAGGRLASIFHTIVGAVGAAIPVIKSIAQWIGNNLVPVIVMIAQGVGPQLISTFKSIGSTIKAHQATFAQLGRVLTVLAMIVMPVLRVGLRLLGAAFKVVADKMDGVVKVVSFLVGAFLTGLGWILHAAAKAFGWIPGLGGKLKAADRAFQAFKDKAMNALSGMGDKGKTVGRDFANGVAKGIRDNTGASVAAAQGLANKVVVMTNHQLQSHSPSRVAIKIGKAWSQGLGIGIHAGENQVVKAAERLAARIIAAVERVKALKQSRSDLATTISGAITGPGTLSGLTLSDTGTITSSDMIKQLQDKVAAARAFAANLKKLGALGLSKSALSDLAQQGAESAGVFAQALVSGGRGAIKQINSLQSQLATTANAAAKFVAGSLYDAGIKAAEGLARGLMRRRKMVLNALGDIAKAMAQKIRQALGIHSPSTVFAEVGRHVGMGLVGGMKSTQGHIDRTVAGLVGAPYGAGAAGRGAGGGGGDTYVTIEGIIGDAQIRQLRNMLDDMARRRGGTLLAPSR